MSFEPPFLRVQHDPTSYLGAMRRSIASLQGYPSPSAGRFSSNLWSAETPVDNRIQVADIVHHEDSDIATLAMTVDGVRLPCVVRDGRQYVLARKTEDQLFGPLLSAYPSLRTEFSRKTMISYRLMWHEVQALRRLCAAVGDVISNETVVISLDDVIKFYNELQMRALAMQCFGGGWVQINNRFVCIETSENAVYRVVTGGRDSAADHTTFQ